VLGMVASLDLSVEQQVVSSMKRKGLMRVAVAGRVKALERCRRVHLAREQLDPVAAFDPNRKPSITLGSHIPALVRDLGPRRPDLTQELAQLWTVEAPRPHQMIGNRWVST
jgi:hypothetical protein